MMRLYQAGGSCWDEGSTARARHPTGALKTKEMGWNQCSDFDAPHLLRLAATSE